MTDDHTSADAGPLDRSPARLRPSVLIAAAVTVALALSGCGARADRRDATPTTPTTAATAASSTAETTSGTVQTDDIGKDLDAVQADLDGASQDLRDGPAEATTDTRG